MLYSCKIRRQYIVASYYIRNFISNSSLLPGSIKKTRNSASSFEMSHRTFMAFRKEATVSDNKYASKGWPSVLMLPLLLIRVHISRPDGWDRLPITTTTTTTTATGFSSSSSSSSFFVSTDQCLR